VRNFSVPFRAHWKSFLVAAVIAVALVQAIPVVSQNRPPWATPKKSDPSDRPPWATPKTAPQQNPASQIPSAARPAVPVTQAPVQSYAAPVTRPIGLNVVVLDPAHGGTDLGARGTEGIHESDVVLQFAGYMKKALEAQGLQVITTRDGNENPSFDDRSARANAQRGAVFITLHIGSTGLAGTARVYVVPEIPIATDNTGLISWDRAQAPFLDLSHKLGDAVQIELAKRFKGSPNTVQVAPVRQLRTTAAPAIAVEISSVSVADRAALDRMIPGVAESVARGVVAFRPTYVIPTFPSPAGVSRP
jgi:N-acetylmuramoyl-L-alanine amidase